MTDITDVTVTFDRRAAEVTRDAISGAVALLTDVDLVSAKTRAASGDLIAALSRAEVLVEVGIIEAMGREERRAAIDLVAEIRRAKRIGEGFDGE